MKPSVIKAMVKNILGHTSKDIDLVKEKLFITVKAMYILDNLKMDIKVDQVNISINH